MGIQIWWWPCFILLWQACLVNAGDAQGTGQLLGFTTRKDKLIRPDKNGKIIILDVSSLHPQPSDDIMPFGSQDWCAEACNRVPDCNAFAFCNDPKGCGTDCARYTADHPQMAKVTPKAGSGYPIPEPTWNGQKTFDRLGPFGKTAQCYGSKPPMMKTKPPQPGDQPWTFGTCTLLKLDNPRNRMFASEKASKGWISGYAVKDSGCQPGIANNTCTECKAFSDPAKCMACAQKLFADLPLLQAAFRPEDPAAECSYPACDKNAGPDTWHDCLMGWVSAQMQKGFGPGAIGGACGSLPPMFHQQCWNRFIWRSLPDAVPRCECKSLDDVQDCLNSVVNDKMQGRPAPVDPNAPTAPTPGKLFASCMQLEPWSTVLECWNEWVIKQQLAAAPPGAVGAGCGTVSPDSQQQCINSWVRDNIPRASVCGGTPEEYQSCIYDVIEHRMRCPAPSPAKPSPAPATSKSCKGLAPDRYQDCIDQWVNGQVVKDEVARTGGTIGGCLNNTPKGGYLRGCINTWIVDNLVDPPAKPGEPRRTGACMGTPSPDKAENDKRYQDCLNGAVEARMAAEAA